MHLISLMSPLRPKRQKKYTPYIKQTYAIKTNEVNSKGDQEFPITMPSAIEACMNTLTDFA